MVTVRAEGELIPFPRLAKLLKASSVEEIKDFHRAVGILETRRRHKENPPA
jgi:hypothetical protein